MPGPRVFVASLGCPKNTIDSEKALGALLSRGACLETDPARADWILVNTCGFIASAKRESLDTLFELAAKRRKGARVILAGCLSKRYGDVLPALVPEADHVVGVLDGRGVRQLEMIVFGTARAKVSCGFAVGPRLRIGPSHSAYLRIAEGCNNRCAYCVIPSIRGPLRSRPMKQVITEARRLAHAGVREFVVVAQDTSNYGADLYGRRSLPKLLGRLGEVPGVEWIRLMYTHPAHVTRHMVKMFVGLKPLLHYIDLPLQHAATDILEQPAIAHLVVGPTQQLQGGVQILDVEEAVHLLRPVPGDSNRICSSCT